MFIVYLLILSILSIFSLSSQSSLPSQSSLTVSLSVFSSIYNDFKLCVTDWLTYSHGMMLEMLSHLKISKWKAIVDWQWLPTSRDDISGQPIQPCSCSTREDDTKNSKYLRPTWVVAHTHTDWKCIFTADGSKVLYFMIFLNLENTCNAI